MRTIAVSASTSYQVTVGSGLLNSAGDRIRRLLPEAVRCAVVTDDNLELLWADRLEDSLQRAGLEVIRFPVTHGEKQKNAETYLSLIRFLAEEELTRTDVMLALGGGMVCDLCGFAAATYLRGVPLVLLPTTLLAMTDAAIGGKTGIDLAAGKNLVGAFYQPCAVLCDIDTLSTLPRREFTEGCAEVLKYAVLCDPNLFQRLLRDGRDFDRERTVADCVAWKARFIAADEKDCGARKLLNLGHTVGHALECASSYSLGHGSAVAIGISAVASAAAAHGICPEETAETICAALRFLELPTESPYPMEELLPYLFRDKKRHGEKLDLIVPEGIGSCRMETIRAAEAAEWLKAGLK